MSNEYNRSPAQRAVAQRNTAETKRKMWNAYSGSRKMKKYHEEQLSQVQSERALKSGTWSDEQLAALRAAGLKC